MIPRRIEMLVKDRLEHLPAVALLGPRQVGKTTLALSEHEDKLVILDEIQRLPELL
jgi:predicted AAA+ superfamily ATPase